MWDDVLLHLLNLGSEPCRLRLVSQVAADGGGGGYTQHMRNLDWEFAVINQPDVNAFVVPGGKVVVYTGEGLQAHSAAASCVCCAHYRWSTQMRVAGS
jgi:predicted Zn-dependent protease